MAAQGVVIPLQCEYFALEGLADVLTTIELVRRGPTPARGRRIVLTMFSREQPREPGGRRDPPDLRHQVFDTVIPRNVRLSEAPSHGKPILLYDVTSKGCQSYLALAREVTSRFSAAGGAA